MHLRGSIAGIVLFFVCVLVRAADTDTFETQIKNEARAQMHNQMRSMVGEFSEVEESTLLRAQQLSVDPLKPDESRDAAISFLKNPQNTFDLAGHAASHMFGVTEDFVKKLQVPIALVAAGEALYSNRLGKSFTKDFLDSTNTGIGLRGTASIKRVGLSMNPEGVLELSNSYKLGLGNQLELRTGATNLDRQGRPRFEASAAATTAATTVRVTSHTSVDQKGVSVSVFNPLVQGGASYLDALERDTLAFHLGMGKNINDQWRMSASARTDIVSDCVTPNANIFLDFSNLTSGFGTVLQFVHDARTGNTAVMLNVRGRLEPRSTRKPATKVKGRLAFPTN